MKTEIVDLWFNRYPNLEIIIGAGTISLKTAREIIGVDRYEMKEIYNDLLLAGAIYGSGSNQFRATKELKEHLELRRNQRNKEAWEHEKE